LSDPSPELTLLQLRAAQAGDREAIEELFERYRDRLLQVVCVLQAKRRRDLPGDEEDIVQDTLLEAFRDLGGFEPRSQGAFLHWLSKLAENNLRDTVRRQQARKRGEGRVRPFADLYRSSLYSSLFPAKQPTPTEMARVHELEEQIEAVVIAMPDRERRMFAMRNLCELSFEEMAVELELASAASVRSLYSRMLARLSESLPAVFRS
jgi:RNA polymerase sigma-70 factor (ECF subfamily)